MQNDKLLIHKGSSGVEQWTENPRVGGSNPPPGTTFQININDLIFLY